MRYRRSDVAGGTYFFTVNLADRSSRLLVEHIDDLRAAVRTVKQRHPFEILAWVVLPDTCMQSGCCRRTTAISPDAGR